MAVSTCPPRSDLAAFLAGTLAPVAAARVLLHLDGCPVCRGLSADAATSSEHDTTPDFNADLPDAIGPYRVFRLLGKGGMGVVFQAVHGELGSPAAVKILPRPWADPAALTRFRREWQAVGRLDHPNIVRGLDAGTADGLPYLAMEYAPGPDLAAVVGTAGPLAVPDAAAVLRAAAAGLAHAHAAGVVHRDVKPGNLVLTADGTVKLLDLGLAGLLDATGSDRLTQHVLIGTADYMPPEHWNPPVKPDPAADVYGLGAVLVYLLTGRAPFPSPEYPSPLAKMKGHGFDAPPDLRLRADVPPGLAAVAERMMAKAPAERPTAAAVAAVIAPFAVGADLIALAAAAAATGRDSATLRPVEPTQLAPRPGPRRTRRWVLAASGAAVTASAAGLAGIFFTRRPAEPPLLRPAGTLDDLPHPVAALAVAPDGSAAFVGTKLGTVLRWEPGRPAEPLWRPDNPDGGWALHGLAVSGDGKVIAAASYRKVWVFDATSGAIRRAIPTPRAVRGIALDATGDILCVGFDLSIKPAEPGENPAAVRYSVGTGEERARVMADFGVKIAPAGDGWADESGAIVAAEPGAKFTAAATEPKARLLFADGELRIVHTESAGRHFAVRSAAGDSLGPGSTSWYARSAARHGAVVLIGTSAGHIGTFGPGREWKPGPVIHATGVGTLAAGGGLVVSAGTDSRAVAAWR